ncbi:phosphate/phosphite/phosphonate ABC transporter substrate-binding protein [Micromonospora saelicesensis]|uniref:ABC-type phosphate/phosphonate transport system, substrate-binding protein n=1 Tax=Micromonospora saelicesensis TaxID=285676 RepID=A0A1C4ZUU5_9ACTN|nr:PhnD/SsuA/transferrin family substrate-binding protein [Micromonospora saelicesensis]SCF36720.1 ABC-type phosphate/phosphonate transport system, substrate-binding protein [Micromonospora saelicesensis]
MPAPTVLLGAVAYDPKVVTIWEGFRTWLRGRGLDFDFVLYSHYERQVEDLLAGRIDAAWNSPLAWLRAERLASANGTAVRALTMRDTDQDLTSVVVVRADSPVRQLADLAGRVVAVGAIDNPQATLIPLGHLAAAGVTVDVRRFDVGVGLHGDHIGGERDAARALTAGEVDAACMIDANHLAFVQEGTLPPEGTRIVAQTARYDHCNMTVRAPESEGVRLFGTLLLGMSYADPQVRPLLDLEGLTAWREGRTTGYDALADAVDASGFYSPDGRVTATDYRP